MTGVHQAWAARASKGQGRYRIMVVSQADSLLQPVRRRRVPVPVLLRHNLPDTEADR